MTKNVGMRSKKERVQLMEMESENLGLVSATETRNGRAICVEDGTVCTMEKKRKLE